VYGGPPERGGGGLSEEREQEILSVL